MILLASSSPRRAELLRQIGVEFEVFPVDIDESRRAGEAPEDYVVRIAVEKAERARAGLAAPAASTPILGADTTIAIDGDIIGKPSDRMSCRDILLRLSGRSHEVLSAVALSMPRRTDWRLSRNRVEFRDLETREIDAYCASDEPRDKAGAYAIQGLAAILSSDSRVATRLSWDCLCTRPRNYCGMRESSCCNDVLERRNTAEYHTPGDPRGDRRERRPAGGLYRA